MARKVSVTGPTMIDVARAAGVSQSCVSLVLNDAPGARLSDATRQRVLSAAQELGYRLPERRSRRVAAEEQGRKAIAYVVDEVSISPHPILHIDGARDAAWAAECLLEIHVTRSHKEIESETLAGIARDPSVIGLIYATSFTREVEPPAAPPHLPTILVNCHTREKLYPTLLPGEVAGGFAATQHLLDHGHHRIAMIGGEAWMDGARDRLRGYREALATADIAAAPELVREGDWSAASGYKHTVELMKLRAPPTAIFCANDMMALGAIEALFDLHLSVPHDVSVVGYNDVELARNLRPPLTTCRVPNYELGRRAVDMIIDAAFFGKPHRPMIAKLECPLVERSSVAFRKAAKTPRAASRRA